MRIKKYTASSMREALLKIKEELGEEAIILKTRKLPKKVFALGSQDEIEVTAAIDEEAVTRPEQFTPLKVNTGVYARPRPSNIIDMEEPDAPEIRPWKPAALGSEKRKTQHLPLVTPSVNNNEDTLQIKELKDNLRELKELVTNILDKKGSAGGSEEFAGAWAAMYRKLCEIEVRPSVAGNLLRKVSSTDIMLSETQIEKKFLVSLQSSFPTAGPLKLKKNGPIVVAFVGPTGSGKTTTLAKLAAHCCLNRRKNVSIITADTYRIAAIEQIRMFADIVKVGLQVVFSPDEIPKALETCANDDIVLVDTAGRSQRNDEHMDDLKLLISTLNPDETHLVLSATTKDSDLSDMIARYKSIEVNRLLFTKLDETVRVGNIMNVVNECNIPVSYFTFGQSIPDDIELAQPARFIQRLWGGQTSE